MEYNDQYDQKTENLFASCDLLLLKLFFKMDVICGFPDVPPETVDLLESLGLLTLKGDHCYITRLGKNAVSKGGVKNFVKDRQLIYSENNLARREKRLLEYPLILGVLLSLILIICLLTWMLIDL
ncbi:MAG: hypothetical protein R3209_12115 [Salinimicrobium sediminis]|nr:hypothetical protein [Salinimicrobium sediminis]